MGQDSTAAGTGWPMGPNRPGRAADLPENDLRHLSEIALALETWPARNPVMRAALDRARDEVLQLALDLQANPRD